MSSLPVAAAGAAAHALAIYANRLQCPPVSPEATRYLGFVGYNVNGPDTAEPQNPRETVPDSFT